jgi:hypothetical protein
MKTFYRNAIFILLICPTVIRAADQPEPTITPGSEDQARQYYARISKTLKAINLTPGTTSIDDLLQFLGYPASGDKLESLDPAILMSPQRGSSPEGLDISLRALGGSTLREGDILAARFFAPKIVNVNVNTNAPIPGWRKLIRLRARPDSPAAHVGIEAAIILFNFIVPVNEQPFTSPSFNTQAMLLAPSQDERLFWLDFDSDKKLALALNASFDAALLQSAGNHNYYVPHGCNACHGSPGDSPAPPMVNYLDTDHWFDRLDDDFKDLKASGRPLIFDAGTNDTTQPSYTAAFDVIRRFNEEALQQNNLVRSNSFEAQAARTWLKLHAGSDEHFPPVQRGFSMSGGQTWQVNEADALGTLNRYCFRCHGSVHFSVFDRPATLTRAGLIQQRIKPTEHQKLQTGWKMPPDRDIPQDQLDALYTFLGNLK